MCIVLKTNKRYFRKSTYIQRFLHLKSVVDKYSKIINNEDIYFNSCQDIRKFYDTFALDEVLTEHPDWKPDGKIFRKDPVEITSATDKVLHQGVYPEDKLIINMSIALDILIMKKYLFN